VKVIAWALLAATLLLALVLGAALAWGLSEGIAPGTAVVIDGERFEVGRLATLLAEHWVLTSLGVLVLAATLVVVVPLVLALAVGLPLLGGALGMALVLAPLVLLVWWLARQPTTTNTTTMRE
jgi:hypothetical protein